MNKVYPAKLKSGDEIRIIAPSRSLAIISEGLREIANDRFSEMGFKLSFGKHLEESDEFLSSTIESRIEDLHDAFKDQSVKAVLTVIGGYNSNQLLRYINWDLIKDNPKIFCGYSDITILNNAIYTKTGLVNYYGPHYSTFGQKLHFDYTLEYFKKCLLSEEEYEVLPSKSWSDDVWYKDQDNRNLVTNDGFIVINQGTASGTILGSHLSTFGLLQGTEYFPKFENSVLFIEEDEESSLVNFDRILQSVIHQPNFNQVKGIVIGRFQRASNNTLELLTKIIKTKKELDHLPVIAGVDFGHTDPKITFPIGGEVEIIAECENTKIELTRH